MSYINRMASAWPPNGETMASFEARIDGAIEQVLNKEFALLALDDEQAHGECNANAPTANIWVLTHGGVIRHLMARALGAVRTVGFYSQLTLPVAAVVTINVLEDKHGTRYWRLDWPSSHGD